MTGAFSKAPRFGLEMTNVTSDKGAGVGSGGLAASEPAGHGQAGSSAHQL